MRVAIVENHPHLAVLLAQALRSAGHDPVSDADPETWVELGGVDAVILDMHLDHPNGLEILRELRVLFPDVRVLVTTGSRDAARKEEVAAHGGIWVQKPYSFDELLELLEAVPKDEPE